MKLDEAVPRVWDTLTDMRIYQVGTQGTTIRVNPRDWQDLRMEAQQRGLKDQDAAQVIYQDTMFGIPVIPDRWVPMGKIFICREVEA